MQTVRRADFAGSWYPGKESECRKAIETFSGEGMPCPKETTNVFGGIVPHAGWYFSGRIACNVFNCLKSRIEPDTCIIFGRHLHPASKNYIMVHGHWTTPLGDLEVDTDIATRITEEFPFEVETATVYEADNTIELQLPFIKYFFPNTRILPLGLPPRTESLKIGVRTAELAKALGRRSLVVGSTDLTHYGYNYGYVPKGVGEDAVEWVKNVNDKRIVDLMVEMDQDKVIAHSLENKSACCSGAAGSAIAAAKALGALRAAKIVYSTSYDVRPDTSFVGYVGIIFYS